MRERRKAKRLPATLTLEILSFYKQNNELIGNIHAPVEAVDISTTGIGFTSKSILPIGYYLNAVIKFEDYGDIINCVIQIVRSQSLGNKKTMYGAKFIGMKDVLAQAIDNYEHDLDTN